MTKTFHSLTRMAVVAVTLLLTLCAVTVAQQNAPPTWVFARAYGAWNIVGQSTNTFSFNGGACQFTPQNASAQSQTFFVFSGTIGSTTVYNPVFIRDVSSSLNEVVTPTATSNTQTTCSATLAPANTHVSYTLLSGTGGLQEAITNQLQVSPIFNVILDQYWYQQVLGMAGAAGYTTPQAIIAAVTGSNNVGIVDTTTAPWTFYSWNGSKYVPDSSTGGVPFTSLTAIAAPVALTTVAATCATNGGGCITTATTGGTIPASGAYTLGATYVTALGGETLMSIDTAAGATVTVGSTATNTITVTSPAAETGAVGWRLWMTAASGATVTEILYASSCQSASTGQIVLNGVCAIGSPATITAIVTGTALAPTLTGATPSVSSAFPVASGTTSPLQAMVSYPPFADQGTIATTVVQPIGEVNFPTGFLNTLGRHLKVHGTGYATTNGTTGTLTFSTQLWSLFGTTSITPFTAVSGTTTGSAVINFTFDIDYTVQVVGSSGKVETHGTICYNLAGTAVCTPAQDLIITNGSAIDLTKQNELDFYLKPTTTGTTHLQLRQLTVQVLQ